ncbi:DEAD-box ATP-dependent RNA helicase [Spiroplasma sabaudiense Ar-1343]|uniref:DEAD-box ATP-dependent RNA helicase n=1 Tax=Spiroplasma sabaudiense Ar-1343 TaxID=1276257 RepID=W6A8V0_9MOLU|nr:DEAD/DEAH box helicase [Spiroplasma sabaudiense]AHI53583.1 DEAD-box ATP-dependent RNA helicase [Spiroplasma sabaudiense Ar-1343]
MNFNEINLKPELQKALARHNLTVATEIQEKTIPLALENRDIIGKSQTGTGKTAAFLLPILERLVPNVNFVQAIIVTPTRELALQVLDKVRDLSMYLEGISSAGVTGGANIARQIQSLKRANIVVGTPGRITDLLNRKALKLNQVRTVVLDEADEMLKMGFKQDINNLFASIPEEHQTLLFSATMNKQVNEIANKYLKNPIEVSVERGALSGANIKQYFIDTKTHNKEDALLAIYSNIKPELSIVFANTKSQTEEISSLLYKNGVRSFVINGDKRQSERNRALKAFKTSATKVLVATDVAARGIDVPGIDYVINYDLPHDHEYYIHRIGRTARAGSSGNSISLVGNRNNFFHLKDLEKYQNKEIEQMDVTSWELPIIERRSGGGNSGGFRRGSDNRSGGGRNFSDNRGSSGGSSRNFKPSSDRPFTKSNDFGGGGSFENNGPSKDRRKRDFNTSKPKRSGYAGGKSKTKSNWS